MEEAVRDDVSERSGSRKSDVRAPLKRRVIHRCKSGGRASPSIATRTYRTAPSPRVRKAAPTPSSPIPPLPAPTAAPRASRSILWKTASLLVWSLHTAIRTIHVILEPFYPYVFLVVFGLLVFSAAVYALFNVIPPLLFRLPGFLFRSLLPDWTGSQDVSDMALGQAFALAPLKTFATPVCALAGQLCALSYLSKEWNGTLEPATPFWQWGRNTEIDAGAVARSLAKEAKGAKDIFESIALLSSGGLMDRLEYVR